jgi:lantibiotic biosynthesis protein
VSDFLEPARAIARRICRDAIWADGSCNWIGPVMDSVNVWDVRYKSFGPDLYSGTSGVALFLASVEHVGHERLIQKTAEGAARHAYNHANDVPPVLCVGMYSGTIGIAWSLVRAGELLGDATWQERGIELLDHVDTDPADAGLDVMSGYAGAIPVLLEMSRRYVRPAWTEMALRWGDRLIDAAEKSSEGWSWKTIEFPGHARGRNLTGFSHGAAGIGWALFELFAITRETRFREAAEGAFQYERTHYDAVNENWPDFRDFLRPPGSPATPAFGTAWCHGAPGIALSRLRAWHLTGSGKARAEAEAAIRTTKRTLESPGAATTGFSLCHGCAGNADVLLEAFNSFDSRDLREIAEGIGYAGIDRFESKRLPWPCGLPGAGETKNLMLGTAGIGYFYLRLENPELPTVLMIGRSGAQKCAAEAESSAVSVL